MDQSHLVRDVVHRFVTDEAFQNTIQVSYFKREKKRAQVVRGFMRINTYIYSNGPSDSCYEN